MISPSLVDIIILLIAAVIVVPLFQAVKFGAVPGFLIAGVIVGPSGLGLISNISEIGHLAEIGVVLLLFIIGIELKPSRLWLMRRLVFGLGSLQVILTGSVLAGACYYFFDIPLRVSALIGPALALSSTAFVLQILTEQRSLRSNYGRTSFSVLLFQDLAVVPLLALVPILSMPELSFGGEIGFALVKSLLILSLVILIGRFFLHPVLHQVALSGNSEVFTASAVLLVLGTALVLEYIGLSMAMGAFIAGLFISDSAYKHQIMAEIHPFRGLFLGLFFISMGMSFNLSLLLEAPRLIFLALGLLIIIKIGLLVPLVFLFGIKAKKSLAVGLLLAQSGEFALVLFSLANQSDLLTEVLFQQLLLVVLLSMFFTPILARLAHILNKTQTKKQIKSIEHPVKAPIVLAGFGRVGHRIGEILTIAGKPFVALDSDALIVERERTNGYPVFYGDVRNSEVLKSAGASKATVIIVTLNDSEAAEHLVSSLRTKHPEVNIYVRGHSLTQCCELRKLGATGVVSEYVDTSLELVLMALIKVDGNEKKQAQIVKDFRRKYYAEIYDVDIPKKKKD